MERLFRYLVKDKDLNRLARQVIRQTRSKADAANVAAGLKEVFYAIGGGASKEEAAKMGVKWAKDVLKKSAMPDEASMEARR